VTTSRRPVSEPPADLDQPGAPRPARTARPYEPPRLSGKQALEKVTLFSFACTPGDPNCPIGRP
jgi:hypothetical protein